MVIDDEPVALKQLRRILEKLGHHVSTFSNPLRALERLEETACDLLISDFKMPYLDGLEVLNRAKRIHPDVEVILITGYKRGDAGKKVRKLFHQGVIVLTNKGGSSFHRIPVRSLLIRRANGTAPVRNRKWA